MSEKFKISIDKEKNMLIVETFDYMDFEDFIAQGQESEPLKDQLDRSAGIKMLFDSSQGKLIKPEVAARLKELEQQNPNTGISKTASVSPSPIATIQANRLIKEMGIQEHTRHFDSKEEAIAWLMA